MANLRRFGVDVSNVLRQGSRLGIYFLEIGATQRGSLVVYDRANSAISEIERGKIPWSDVFQDAGWFHITGITPAISPVFTSCLLDPAQDTGDSTRQAFIFSRFKFLGIVQLGSHTDARRA